MSTHELKTWPREFAAVRCGDKTFELRKNDRGFRKLDDLLLREWCPRTESYTGRRCWAQVTYLLNGGQFGLPEGYVVMSLGDVVDDDIASATRD